MGLDAEKIADYFARGGEVTELLSMLEERLRELSRGVEELRLRAGGERRAFHPADDPARRDLLCAALRGPHHRGEIQRHVRLLRPVRPSGLPPFPHEPIFTISERTDYLEGRIDDTPYPFHVCVPVRPETPPRRR